VTKLEPDLRRGAFQDRYLNLGGESVRYWSYGESGSAVVLIHGITGSVEDWTYNMGSLSLSHRVFALELASLGALPTDQSGISLDDTILLVKEFIETLGISKTAVIGHSLGGQVALHFASHFTDLTTHLVLVASSGLGREVSFTLRLSSNPLARILFRTPSRRALEMGLRSIVYDPARISTEMVDSGFRRSKLPGYSKSFASLLRAGVDWRGQRGIIVRSTLEDLGHVVAPTLVIWGRQDRVLPPSHAMVVARALPGARVVFFDHCGHLPQIERPQEFNSAVLDFLVG
jgi:pimeloyl-ACP methyl ester carboxylesterase